ncbi:MAG: serine hydrolase [Thermoplasmatales archaeon]
MTNEMFSRELEKFDDFIFSKVTETKLPSVTISILNRNQIIHTRAFGFKNVVDAIPADIDTIYGIGSVSKSFTSLAISKLVEDGLLDFHDKITDFFPSLLGRGFDDVEIHHLLSHTSGIPGLGWAETLIYYATGKTKNWLPITTADDMASFLNEASGWRESPPGSKFFYLNEGYFLLGELISKVSGKSYGEYVKENILKPLSMKRTFFKKEDVESDGNFATPYLFDNGRLVPSSIPWQSQPAAGGIMSNVRDLSNYVMMYLNKGKFSGNNVIGEDMIEKMWLPYSKPPKSIFPDIGYGYGFFTTRKFYSERLLYHGGSVSVYASAIAFLPERGIGVSVLMNAEAYDPVLLCLYGLSLMLGEDPEDALVPFRIENLLRKLEGVYKTYKGLLSARVTRNGDFLMLSGEDVGDHILIPDNLGENQSEEAKFFTLSRSARMEVIFRLTGSGVEMIFERYRYRKCYC